MSHHSLVYFREGRTLVKKCFLVLKKVWVEAGADLWSRGPISLYVLGALEVCILQCHHQLIYYLKKMTVLLCRVTNKASYL